MVNQEPPIGTFQRKARVEHICNQCNESIPIGAWYIYLKTAPWQNWDADADDSGRRIAVQYRESKWKISHYCMNCYDKVYDAQLSY